MGDRPTDVPRQFAPPSSLPGQAVGEQGGSEIVPERRAGGAGARFQSAEPQAGIGVCACCGARTYPAFAIQDINRRISDREFSYGRCSQCGTYQLEDPPEDLGAYYPSSYYANMDADLGSDDARLAAGQVAIFAPLVGGGRIIEIGPAVGSLLRIAALRGFSDRAAVERDRHCCELLRGDGVEVVETVDPIAGIRQLEPADAVVMFHLIEHVPDPMGLLDAAAARVKPGGVLVVATPNPQSLSFRVCGKWWTHVEAPRHLFLLPLSAIAERAGAAGLVKVRVVTADPTGLVCNGVAWTPWCHRIFGDLLGRIIRYVLVRAIRPVERRGLNGSTYTAVFRRLA